MSKISRSVYRALPSWMRNRVNQVLVPLGSTVLSDADGQASSILEDSFRARVVHIHDETQRASTITFELLEGYRFNFKSGQSVTVSMPIGGVLFQRCYSFSSAPHENRYSITVQRSFQGRLSYFLTDMLKVGDEFFVSDPYGEFVLPATQPENQRYVMVAGGAGIGPVYSLIKDLLGKNPDVEIQLMYASRSQDECIFRRELERLARQHPGFTIRFEYTRKDGIHHDASLHLDGHKILSRLSDPASALFYLCGPNGLMKKCMEAFHAAGISESRIRLELFNAPPASASVQTELRPRLVTFFPSTLLGKVRHVRQREVQTVLEAAQSAGLDIPQQCTVGNCKTCKVKLKSGSVIMDEPNLLTLEEAQQGYVLSCVSYPCENLMIQLPGR